MLRDIKDFSFFDVSLGPYLVLVSFFILVIIIYFFVKFKNRKLSRKDRIRRYLKKYNYNKDAKTIAYEFTILAKELIDKKDLDEYNKIVSHLEKYKYKKDVPTKIDKDILKEIKEFIRVRL